MDAAIDLATETVNSVDGVDTKETGAWFWDYGESSMEIRLEYHVDDLDRWKEVRSTVNHEIQRAFWDAGYEMAFPTRTVRVEQDGENSVVAGQGGAEGD